MGVTAGNDRNLVLLAVLEQRRNVFSAPMRPLRGDAELLLIPWRCAHEKQLYEFS